MFRTVDSVDQGTSEGENIITSNSDVHGPTEKSSTKPAGRRDITLNMLLRELILCIALALTTYGALQNSPPKISKHPQAIPFFPRGSLVKDWYRGHLNKAFADISHSDISLVMYYAPWDAECQYVRGEVERAALVLSDRVHFAAINCWNPGSECRLQHGKIPSWPVLMVYTINSKGIIYKGPRDAHSIVKFVEMIITPFKRVSRAEDLVNLLSICDAVAVGYTPLSDTSKFYNAWYSAALKVKELDVIGEICFAVVTSEDLCRTLGVELVPSAKIMLWNETKEFNEETWTELSLTQWVLNTFVQPSAKIIPMWQKAFSFQRYVDGNPLLILFTPLNPLYEQQPAYDLLREVSMEYLNCNSNQWTIELTKLQRVQRLLYQQKNIIKSCKEYNINNNRGIKKNDNHLKRDILAQYNKVWHNSTQSKKQKHTFKEFLLKSGITIASSFEIERDGLLSPVSLLDECHSKVFPAEKKQYEEYEKCEAVEEKLHLSQIGYSHSIEISMLPEENDPLSSEKLTHDQIHNFCKLIRFAQHLGEPVFPRNEANVSEVTGLACRRNYTLNFIAIDSVRNHHFAESLGINISKKSDKTAVVILDSQSESQYELSEPYSAKSLRDFILNFTNKNLKRSLRSQIDDPEFTHYYGSDSIIFEENVRTEGKEEDKLEEVSKEDVRNNEMDVNIVDLTTHTFEKFIRDHKSTSLVLICGGSCAASSVRAASTAVRLLRECGVQASAGRLDAVRHDLPWHYTAHTLPTLLVFKPGHRSAEDSAVYPTQERLSASGVLALVLRTLRAPSRLRVRLALCARALATESKEKCLTEIRQHVTTLIGRNLNYWRQIIDTKIRGKLLQRLQNLHKVEFHLEALHISQIQINNPYKLLLTNFLSSLDKTWDIDINTMKLGRHSMRHSAKGRTL